MGPFAALAVIAVATRTRAEVPTSHADEMEVLVHGDIEDRSSPAYVATRQELAEEPSGRVENAVTDMPSATQFRRSDARSAHPTSQGLTLRGLGGNAASRVLVLYDGVPVADPFGGWISWPSYDALPMAALRLERGGGSGEHGSGALGGTLELETAEPRSLGLEGSILGGSRDSIAWRLAAGLPTGPVTTALGMRHESSAGFVPISPDQRGPVDQPASYSQFAGALKSRFSLSKTGFLEIGARAFSDSRSRGVPFTESHNDGLDLSVRWGRDRGPGARWTLLGYVQDRELRSSFASVADDRSSALQVLDQYSVPSTGWGGRFELAPDLGSAVALRMGVDGRAVLGQTNERYLFVAGAPTRARHAGGQNDTLGAFVALDGKLARSLTLSASARADVAWLEGGFRQESELGGAVLSDETFDERFLVEPTARLGVGVDVAGGLRLRSAAYTGFRLPTLNELYRPFRVGADAVAANDALAAERLLGAEIGFDVDRVTGLGFSLTAFENHLLGAIANVTLAEGPGQFPGVGFVSGAGTYARRENLGSLRTLGIETELRLDGQELLGVPARAELSYVHVSARVIDERAMVGARPAQVPENTWTARVTADPIRGRVRLGATVRFVGAQFEDDRNEVMLADAATLDLALSARLIGSLALLLRAENVTDTPVEVARDALGTVELGLPRTFWLGVSLGNVFALAGPSG